MRASITTTIIFLCSLAYAQDTTAWETIGSAHRNSQDTTSEWMSGGVYSVNDTVSIQYRHSVKGVIQRREIWYKRD